MALLPPVDGAEEYLAAIHDRLGETNALLSQLVDRFTQVEESQPAGQVELREPTAASRPGPGARPKTKPTTRPRAGATRKEA